jgi:type I restriction enzyme S subunit
MGELVPTLFYEMFGDPVENPMGWPVVAVGTLFDSTRHGVRTGPFGSLLKKHEYVSSGIPVWGIPNVLPNQFMDQPEQYVSNAKYNELVSYSVQQGDLLISRAGTVGRVCVAQPSTQKSVFGTNLIRVALDRSTVDPQFLSTYLTYFLNSDSVRADENGRSYSFVSTSSLKAVPIPLPGLGLQREFASYQKGFDSLHASQTTASADYDRLFESLLSGLLGG